MSRAPLFACLSRIAALACALSFLAAVAHVAAMLRALPL